MAKKKILLSEHDYTWIKEWSNKNVKTISEVYCTKTDKTKYWWVCDKGQNHEYQTTIASRIAGAGCNICSGRVVLKGFNDISTTHPKIAKYYAHEYNEESIEEISFGMNKEFNWICPKEGHIFPSTVISFNKGINTPTAGCCYCRGRRILIGYNDLAHTAPEIANMWDYDKNEDTPYDWTSSSRQKRWFKCENGHNDYKEIFRKVDVPTCFECYKEKLYQNDKLSIQQWDSLINKNKTNTKVLYERTITREKLIPYLVDEKDYYELIAKDTHSNINFICKNGHIKNTKIKRMLKSQTCIDCSKVAPIIKRDRKTKTIKEIDNRNLLINVRPELKQQYSKNNDKNFDNLSYGSNYVAEWICRENNKHVWEQKINKRSIIDRDTGCPYCKQEKRFLVNNFPELEKQYCEDNKYKFDELLTYDDRRVKWRCLENPEHTFYKKVKSMRLHRACHKCVDGSHTSKDEKEIFKELKNLFPNNDLTNNDRDAIGGNFELDMYFKDLKIAIEYNGIYWHDIEKHPYMKDRHYRKQQECIYNGIMLIVIWEDDYMSNQEQVLKDLETMIKQKTVMEKYTYEARNAI